MVSRLDGEYSKRRKFSMEEIEEIKDAFEKYIDSTDDPTLVRFIVTDKTARKYKIFDEDLRRYRAFRHLTMLAKKKQEMFLLSKGMGGQGTAMSIFRLKQPTFGYRDKFEQDLTTGGEKITFVNNVPRPVPKKEK